MKTSVIGFPRIGKNRELKFVIEKYFKGEATLADLQKEGRVQREFALTAQNNAGIDYISSNDFSYYDGVLDTALQFNIIPRRYKELGLSPLDTYFAMARGYQGEKGNVKALAMKKWFNTNYHYIVPEIEDDAYVILNGTKIFDEYDEATSLGIKTKPVILTTSAMDFMPQGGQGGMQMPGFNIRSLKADDYPTWTQRRRALVKLLTEIGKEPANTFPGMGGFGGGRNGGGRNGGGNRRGGGFGGGGFGGGFGGGGFGGGFPQGGGF